MSLFPRTQQVVADTGHSLAEELDEFLADHAARVIERASVVASRISALEAEAAALTRSQDRHASLSS